MHIKFYNYNKRLYMLMIGRRSARLFHKPSQLLTLSLIVYRV